MYVVWRGSLQPCAFFAILFGVMATIAKLISVYSYSTLLTKFNFLLSILFCGVDFVS